MKIYLLTFVEKETLKNEIKETENHIKELEIKDKSKNNSNQSNHPKKGYGKLFLTGTIVLSAILTSLVIMKFVIGEKKLTRK